MQEGKSKVDTGRPISIHFHPFEYEKNAHAVEKSENGMKRKYLFGVSSGLMRDGHGERMTENCIKSMMEQGNSGNVLLYAGLHGVNFVDDLGILAESTINKSGEWVTGYRLYDEYDSDSIGKETVEKAQKLWSQVNGLLPYKKPIQKGFSIEGVVPEDQILNKKINPDGTWSNRVINDIILDGTVVVNRPAYQDSVVTAIYKCLQEYSPESVGHIQTKYKSLLSTAIEERESERNFYQRFFELNSVLEEKISDIMKIPESDGRIQQRLDILFDEYKTLMVGLILQNAKIFQEPVIISGDVQPPSVVIAEKQQKLMKQLAITSRQFSNLIIKRLGGQDEGTKKFSSKNAFS
jgi:hypothetical protein